MRAVTVFCAAREGCDPAFGRAAEALGRGLAERGVRIVYGGGGAGLMGRLARAALARGGAVTGVIPHFLMEREQGQPALSELVTVADMHARKRVLFERADAFVVLPGGLGTLEEALEVITWRQLGLHDKPIVVLSVAGCWSGFGAMVGDVIRHGFADPGAAELFRVVETVEDALSTLEHGVRDRLRPRQARAHARRR